MSALVSASTSASTATRHDTARPSFVGIVRGELFKVSRQLSTWMLGVLLLGPSACPTRRTVKQLQGRYAAESHVGDL